MKYILIISLLLLWGSSAQAFSLTEVNGKFECLSLNYQICAMGFERRLMEDYPDLIERKYGFLRVKLHSGDYFKIYDKNEAFNALEVSTDEKYLVLREQYFEGNTWHLLNLKTGKLIETRGYPYFSPNNDKVVCIEQDVFANYSPNVLDLYEIKDDTLVKVFSGISKNDNWGPGKVTWINNEQVSFFIIKENTNRYDVNAPLFLEEPAILEKHDNKWQIRLTGKK